MNIQKIFSTSQRPYLKPFEDYSQHEIWNRNAHVSGAVPRGTLVRLEAYDAYGSGNTNVLQNKGRSYFTKNALVADANTPAYVFAVKPETTWKLETCTSGDVPFGFMLVDVVTQGYKDAVLQDVTYDKRWLDQHTAVPSGQPVPVLTRGYVRMNAINGTPGPGSGAIVSDTIPGEVDVAAYAASVANVGKFVSGKDNEGYAILKVEL